MKANEIYDIEHRPIVPVVIGQNQSSGSLSCLWGFAGSDKGSVTEYMIEHKVLLLPDLRFPTPSIKTEKSFGTLGDVWSV